ncbi:MAG: hypothetical protein AABW92_05605, partial [Nanoarchaeota archaeon]
PPTRSGYLDGCYEDAFERIPIKDHLLNVVKYEPFDIEIYPGLDSSFSKTVTLIKAENKAENIENKLQYFMLEGNNSFGPNEKITVTYWKFKKDFQLDSIYLGCFLGFSVGNISSDYGVPIRTELPMEGFIEYNSIRQAVPDK